MKLVTAWGSTTACNPAQQWRRGAMATATAQRRTTVGIERRSHEERWRESRGADGIKWRVDRVGRGGARWQVVTLLVTSWGLMD